MKKLNPLEQIIVNYSKWIEEDVKNFKEKIKKNKFFTKFKENKKKYILTTSFSIIAIIGIFIGLLQFNNYMNYRDMFLGPNVSRLNITDSIGYTGEISMGNIFGEGYLSIRTNDYRMTLEGTFDEPSIKNESKKEAMNVKLGKFKEGYIEILDIKNNYTYTWTGTFDNYVLKKGSIVIDKGNIVYTYEGTFENGNLQGFGKKTILKEGVTKVVEGWFEDGVMYENEQVFENSIKEETEESTGGRRENNY